MMMYMTDAKGSKIPKAKIKSIKEELSKILKKSGINGFEADAESYIESLGYYGNVSFYQSSWSAGFLVRIAKDVSKMTSFNYSTMTFNV